jgi:membrane fusion protein, multidrug efflux system
VRAVDGGNKVIFIPVAVAEDEQNSMWVTGIADGAQVIVQGQDFVREGEAVTPVPAAGSGDAAKTAAAE